MSGRDSEKHITGLTGEYYSNLSKKQQMFILLLDFRRAFDTMSHVFISRTIHKMGFPIWVNNMISALLTNVWVFPTLAKRTDHKIRILKGVKQGCPLSPLLFVLCLEVLLDKVRSLHGNSLFAYADDVALGTAVIEAIIQALRMTRSFTFYSGLHVNQDKTKIVTTRKPKGWVRLRLVAEGWDAVDLKFEGSTWGYLSAPASGLQKSSRRPSRNSKADSTPIRGSCAARPSTRGF